VFVISDYFHAIKRNLLQGFLLGLIDCAVIFMLGFDFLYFYNAPVGGFNTIMTAALVAIIIIYLLMSFYTHLMLVTFDMKISKIFKNALIFAFLGFKRNFLACVGIILTLIINFYIMWLYTPIGIVLPLIITVGLCMFMATYAAWPKIKEIMIDPYESPSDSSPEDDDEEGSSISSENE
jgi:uncharacterized membrane protein YesL